MLVEFVCPLCTQTVLAPPEIEGTAAACPKCAGDVAVWSAPAPVPPPVRFTFPCPMCGIKVAAELAHVGLPARCATCGADLVIPEPPPEPVPEPVVPVLAVVPTPEPVPAPVLPRPPRPAPVTAPGTPGIRRPARASGLGSLTSWVVVWAVVTVIGVGLMWADLGPGAAFLAPFVTTTLMLGVAGFHYGQTPCRGCGCRWAGRRYDPVRSEWGRSKEGDPSPYRCSNCGTRL